MPLAIGNAPSTDWMNSAALLIQDYTGDTVNVGTDPLKTIKHVEISPYFVIKLKEIATVFTELFLKL